MKVYIVFWNSSEYEDDVVDKVFLDKKKAREYCMHQNKVTDMSWTYEEMEVEE